MQDKEQDYTLQPASSVQEDATKLLGWVYCYQGQEPAFSYTQQPQGIPKTHYWQVPVFDIKQARTTQQDALDAARYRFLRNSEWDVATLIYFALMNCPDTAEELDTAIDATRAAQEGK